MMQNALFSAFVAQLWLAVLAIAAPVAQDTLTTADHGNAWHYGTGGGIVGLIVLILDIIVFGAYSAKSPPSLAHKRWRGHRETRSCLLTAYPPALQSR